MTINDYNKIQINYNIKRNADNQIVERSTMVNIRCDSTEESVKLYNELKTSLNGELTPHGADDKLVEPVKEEADNPFEYFTSGSDACPRCGGELKERKSKTGNSFMGCSNYPNCRFVRDI